MEKLRQARLVLAAIAQMSGVSERWWQRGVDQQQQALPQAIEVTYNASSPV